MSLDAKLNGLSDLSNEPFVIQNAVDVCTPFGVFCDGGRPWNGVVDPTHWDRSCAFLRADKTWKASDFLEILASILCLYVVVICFGGHIMKIYEYKE